MNPRNPSIRRIGAAQSTTAVVLLITVLSLVNHNALGFTVDYGRSSSLLSTPRTTVPPCLITTNTKWKQVHLSRRTTGGLCCLWESSSPSSSSPENENNTQDDESKSSQRSNKTDEDLIIVRGSGNDNLDGAIWEDIETGQPPQWMVMKEILGINVFTYILAGLIALFLSLNFFLGPGWLGQAMGMQGTGSFTEVSDSLPDTVDLSGPEFRL